MDQLVAHFGYGALFVGTLIEGEGFIFVAGFLAHRGYLQLGYVMVFAALGAFAGDLLYFAVGHRFGRSLLEKSRRARALIPWLEGFMERHHVLWIFGMRYLYGIRWLGAALAGSSRMRVTRFGVLSLLACLVWSIVVGLVGFGAGEMAERLLGDLRHYELWVTGVLVLTVAVYAGLARKGERRLEEP